MKTSIKITTILFILLFTNMVQAQKTGKVEYPSLGISFTIPEGWVGQETETGFIMGSNTVAGFILMTTHDAKDLAGIEAEARQGIVDNQGTSMKLAGNIEKIQQNTVGALFSGTISYETAKAYVIGMVNPYGTGITILTATLPSSYSDTHKKAGTQVAQSVQFYAPVISSESKKWKEGLMNCRLTYMKSYNSGDGSGYNDQIKIDLCGQGYFNYNSNSYTSFGSNIGYNNPNSSNKGAGTWTIKDNTQGQPFLQLNFYNGEVYEYILSLNNENKPLLNGKKYFKTYTGKNIPNCY